MFKKDFIYIILITFAVWWGAKGLFKYRYYHTHDGNQHISRSFDAIQTIKEGHFPLRWAGSLNNHCGVPIFNFFYPLIYYLIIGLDYVINDIFLSLKLISLFSLFTGTISFYLWAKTETRDKLVSFTGAMVYLFAPYRFLLIFVRGSPEYLAYGLFPVLLLLLNLAFRKLTNRKSWLYFFLFSLMGGLWTFSHNFVVMLTFPLLLIYFIYKLCENRHKINLNQSILIIIYFLSLFGLGSFFIGPALIEKQYVQIGKRHVVDYRLHYPTFKQLIRSPWGYVGSNPGVKNDGMSFQLGYVQWLVVGITGLMILKWLIKRRKLTSNRIKVFGLFSLVLVTIFFILPWSNFIWQVLPLLQQIQFSWRLLGIAVLLVSILTMYVLNQFKGIKKVFLALFFVFFALYGNRNHLLAEPVRNYQQYENYTEKHPNRYSTTTVGDDVLVLGADEPCSQNTPLVQSLDEQKINYQIISRRNTSGKIMFGSLENIEGIKLRLMFYPEVYKIILNDNQIKPKNCQGFVCLKDISLKESNTLEWQINQSPIQKMFNYLSLATFVGLSLITLVKTNGLYAKLITN